MTTPRIVAWTLPSVLVAALGMWLVLRHVGRPTPPTPLATRIIEQSADLPASPVAPGSGDDPGAWQAALESAADERDLLQRLRRSPRLDLIEQSRSLPLLVRASQRGGAGVFSDEPARALSHGSPAPSIVAAQDLGRAAIAAALLVAPEDGVRASALAGAAHLLGRRLCDEQLGWSAFALGMGLTGSSAIVLARLDEQRGDAAAAEAWRAFDAGRAAMTDGLLETQRVLGSVDLPTVDRHAGDYPRVANEASQRLWRVEATLALGRLKHLAARSGDRRAAERAIERLLSDSDPAVRAAAERSRDLTLQHLRTLQ